MRKPANILVPTLALVALSYSLFTTYTSRVHWFPDTRFYAVRALQLAGRSHAEAKAEAGAFLGARNVYGQIQDVDGGDRVVYRPRILYPLLSAPFVAVAGMKGLLVVPFGSMLALCFCLWRLFSRRGPPWAALIVFILVVNTFPLAVYSVAALTDGLALALLAAALLGFPGEERPEGAPWFVFAATLAAGLTREIAPYLAMAAFSGWVWAYFRAREAAPAWRRSTVAAGAGTALTLAWTALTGPGNLLFVIEKFAQRYGLSMMDAWQKVIGETLGRTRGAIGRDWVLLILLALVLAGAIRARRERELWFTLSALLASAALLVVNPTFTNVRLQLPILPFAALLAVRAIAPPPKPAGEAVDREKRAERRGEASGAPV